MNMRNSELPWELFEDDAYECLLLDTSIEYKSERIVSEDEWGAEVQYHVLDVRVTLRHNGRRVGVHLDNDFKYELEETIGRHLTNLYSR